MKPIFFIIAAILYVSCKKETTVVVTSDPCDKVFDLNSELYGSFFKGSLRRKDCIIGTLIPVYPDKYSYFDFCVNPNNDYEICYLRRINDKLHGNGDNDLYKFNFCTGKSMLLAEQVTFVDWSKKDWIIFTKNFNQLWKMKSNGDSLMLLSKIGDIQKDAKWSPDGTKYIYNGKSIADETGNLLTELPYESSSCTWLNNEEILFKKMLQDTFVDLKSYNLKTGIIKTVYAENPVIYIQKYNPKYDDAFISIIKNGIRKFAKINVNTWKSTAMGDYHEGYIPSSFTIVKDQLMYNLILKDTFTNKPCMENQRYHIAIKNLNDTIERQLKLPE